MLPSFILFFACRPNALFSFVYFRLLSIDMRFLWISSNFCTSLYHRQFVSLANCLFQWMSCSWCIKGYTRTFLSFTLCFNVLFTFLISLLLGEMKLARQLFSMLVLLIWFTLVNAFFGPKLKMVSTSSEKYTFLNWRMLSRCIKLWTV